VSYRQIRQELDKGLPKPLYLIYGEPFILDEVRERAAEIFGGDGGDFNCDVFRAGEDSVDDIVISAATVALFGGRRLLVVLDAGLFKKNHIAGLERLFEQAGESSCVLFLAPKVDKRTGIFSAFKKRKLPCLSAEVTERETPAWVSSQARNLGVEIEDAAAAYLVERVGVDLLVLRRELEKISLSGRRSISTADIDEYLTAERDVSPFDLTRVLEQGRPSEVLGILSRLLDGGQEPSSLVGVLRWYYTKRARNKKDLPRVLEALHRSDVDLKSTGKPPRLVLEALVVRLVRGFG